MGSFPYKGEGIAYSSLPCKISNNQGLLDKLPNNQEFVQSS
jgi:hypothetical protein